MADAFDRFEGTDSTKGDAFDRFPTQSESLGKSLLRTTLQIPQAIAEGTGPGIAAGLFHLLAAGESDLSPEEFHNLRALAEEKGGQFDDESYENARQQMLGMIPTVSNIAREVEERTGLPLEPKTRLQKGIRFGTNVAKTLPKKGGDIAPHGTGLRGTNTALPRPITALGVEGVREGLIQLGVPEPVADLVSLSAIKRMGADASSLDVGSKTKPSGLTERRFENIQKPTEISPGKHLKLNERIEGDFKKISDDIVAQSPVGETYLNLKKDSSFKEAAREGFKKVQDLSEQIPDVFPTSDVKRKLTDRMKKKSDTGFLASEYEKEFEGFVKQFLKETKDKSISAPDLVKQFRKINGDFSKINEPGKSYAYNQAKRDALREYNLAIEDVIREKFPDSEFGKLFETTNSDWSKIMDAEVIDGFVNDLFDGKIDFKKGRDFFEKNGYQAPFRRALGDKGYNDFKTLLNDLMSTEQAHKLLKVAESKGFTDLAKTGLGYLVHPNIGKAKFAYDILKGTTKNLYQMTLDKPQLAVTWNKGIRAMKKGDFKIAEKNFAELDREVARQQALGKFNEKVKKEKENSIPKE